MKPKSFAPTHRSPKTNKSARLSFRRGCLLSIGALAAAGFQNIQAANIYWDGTATGWNAVGSWSTASGATTPDPAAVPGSADIAIFNISTVNTAATVNLNAAQSVLGLSFLSSGTVLLRGGGTNQILTLGASGITKTGTGAVTIGSVTAGQQVTLALSADQTWANDNNTGAINILNGVASSTAVNCSLTLGGTSTAANIVSGIIANNGAGVFSLAKSGAGTWTLSGVNTYTGVTTVNSGMLILSGSGTAILSTGFTINSGGTLRLDNTSANNPNRIGAVTVTMNGGMFDFSHPTANNAVDYTETAGALSISSGASTVFTSTAYTGMQESSVLTFASLGRIAGGTVNFTGSLSSGNNDNNVRFTSAPTLVNGIIGGYATVGSTGWATYTGGGAASVEALGTYVSTATNLNVAADYLNDNIDVTTSQTPGAAITPNSLRFNNSTARTLTLQGINTITSGGILVTANAANGGTITGGTLTGAAGADLVVHQHSGAGSLAINSVIANNTSATGLTKSGTGTLSLGSANTYTGNTIINAGTLALSSTGSIAAGSPVIDVESGATLNVSAVSGGWTVQGINAATRQILTGFGGVTGATVIGSFGTHNAGDSGAGTQSLSSSLTYSSGSIFQWDIDVNGASETHDKVTSTSLGGAGAEFKILLGSGDSFADTFWSTNHDWAASDLFGASNVNANLATIFNSTNTTTNFGANSVYGTFSFTSTGSGPGNQLTWTAVPEPTSALAGILLGAGLLRRKRNPRQPA